MCVARNVRPPLGKICNPRVQLDLWPRRYARAILHSSMVCGSTFPTWAVKSTHSSKEDAVDARVVGVATPWALELLGSSLQPLDTCVASLLGASAYCTQNLSRCTLRFGCDEHRGAATCRTGPALHAQHEHVHVYSHYHHGVHSATHVMYMSQPSIRREWLL